MKAPPRTRRGSRRGVALLFALGILVLLSVFALSFANLTRLERLAAANMRLQVQAAALAEAGVAQACGQARDAARRRPWVEPSDWWANGSVYPNRLNRHASDPDWGQNLSMNAYGGSDRVEIISYDVASKLDVNLDTPNIKQALIKVGLTTDEYDKIKAARTLRGGRLRSRDELRELLVDPAAVDPEARYRAVRDFITVHSGQRLTAKGAPGGDLPWSYTQGTRATSPVNLNAAPKVVLEAVLTGVEGKPITANGEGPASEWLRSDFRAQRGVVGVGTQIGISATTAAKLADEIVACRTKGASPAGLLYTTAPFGGPFRSWAQFDAFLAANATTTGILTPAEHALVLALAHTDARHMGYNPDISRRVVDSPDLFDKMSITKQTTSLSIVCAGILEVRATGWITGLAERTTTTTADLSVPLPLAEAELDRVVRVFMPMHVGSQEELEAACAYPDRIIYQSMPELVPRTDVPGSADPVDGHFRLTTEKTVAGGVGAYSSAFRAAANPFAPYVGSRGVNTLRAGGLLAPDGVLVWRKSWETDSASVRLVTDLPATLGDEGSFELWVKLATPPTLGTDEVLLTVAVDETDLWAGITPATMGLSDYVLPQKLGATIKLERFAGRLRATWFYWGKPTGAVSLYKLALSEEQQDISAWKAGEWHHVAVSWKNTPQDWAQASIGVVKPAPPGDGVTLWVDGVSNAPIEAFDYAALEPYLLQSVKYHTGRSQTVPTVEGVHIGGFLVNTNAGEDVHSTGVTPGTELKRYTNATIDDVFVYLAPYGSAGGVVPRPRDFRYEKNDGNVAVLFDFPVGTYCQVGCVTAEVELPTGSSARLGIPSGTNVTATQAVAPGPTTFARSPTATPAPRALLLEANEVTVSSGVLRLEVILKGNGLASPVLEGFTILLLPPPQVIEDYRDF